MAKDKKMYHLEVRITDPETGLVSTKVILRDCDEYEEYFTRLIDSSDQSVVGKVVSDDTALGEVTRGKVYHYRRGARGSSYSDTTIQYRFDEDGNLRFDDFSPTSIGGRVIDVKHGEDCDLLGVKIGDQLVALTDAKEANTLRWLFYSTQKFNNGLQEEVARHGDDLEEDEEGEEDKEDDKNDSPSTSESDNSVSYVSPNY